MKKSTMVNKQTKSRKNISVCMLGEFVVVVNGEIHPELMGLSPKGISLLELLAMEEGKPVSREKLCNELWPGQEKAVISLKTLISRTRSHLERISPVLGECIATEYASYSWRCLPGVTVDLHEVFSLLSDLACVPDGAEQWQLTKELVEKYKSGLYLTGDLKSGAMLAAKIHERVLGQVYRGIDYLKEKGELLSVYELCRKLLTVDSTNPRLNAECESACQQLGLMDFHQLEPENRQKAELQRKPRPALTEQQIQALSGNPCIRNVTGKTVRFTEEFKEQFAREYEAGRNPGDILREAGIDPELLSWERVLHLCRISKKYSQKNSNIHARGRQIRNQSEYLRMSRRIKELEAAVEFLNRELQAQPRKVQ